MAANRRLEFLRKLLLPKVFLVSQYPFIYQLWRRYSEITAELLQCKDFNMAAICHFGCLKISHLHFQVTVKVHPHSRMYGHPKLD